MLYRKPRKGETIVWPTEPMGDRHHIVASTPEGDSNLCWLIDGNEPHSRGPAPFLWRFHDGTLNQLACNLDDKGEPE